MIDKNYKYNLGNSQKVFIHYIKSEIHTIYSLTRLRPLWTIFLLLKVIFAGRGKLLGMVSGSKINSVLI